MKTGIIGTGGVGGYFGAKIASAGNDVIFIARGKNLEALRANGLLVKSFLGDFKIDKPNCTDKLSGLKDIDLIILSVKAWQVKDIARELKSVIKDNCVILPLQNGVLAMSELSEELGPKRVLGGLCRIMSKIESPGVITHFGVQPKIVFGEANNQMSARLVNIRDLFINSGFEAVISSDIQADLWKKFIPICISGLLAVTKTTYGELRELKETRQMMIDLLNEIFLLSKAFNIQIENDFIDKTIANIDSFPYDATSSLTRDVWEGKPSEIEYQNGTVVRLAEKAGMVVPINRFIYNCILPMQLKASSK